MRGVCHERWRLHPFRIMHPIHLTDVWLMPALIELMSLVHRACRNDCPCCLSRTSLFIDFVVAREECSKRLFCSMSLFWHPLDCLLVHAICFGSVLGIRGSCFFYVRRNKAVISCSATASYLSNTAFLRFLMSCKEI